MMTNQEKKLRTVLIPPNSGELKTAMKEYRIEGIRNRFYWDGGDRVLMENLRTGKMIEAKPPHYSQTTLYFRPTKAKGPGYVRLTLGQTLACLRTGCSLEVLKRAKIRLSSLGYPMTSEDYIKKLGGAKREDRFKNLEEIEKTVEVIRALTEGNPLPLYTNLRENYKWICTRAYQHFGILRRQVDELWDEAQLATEQQLREFRIRSLQKLAFYMVTHLQKQKIKKFQRATDVTYNRKCSDYDTEG